MNLNNIEEHTQSKPLTVREISRIVATMIISGVLYSGDSSYYTIKSHIFRYSLWKEDSNDTYDINPDETFVVHLVEGTLEHKNNILNIIEKNIKSNKIVLSKLDKTILSILMLGCFEILEGKLDTKIIISQYLVMGECFFSSNEISIINAILQNIFNTTK